MKKIRVIIGAIALAVLIIAASVAYDALSSKQAPNIALNPTPTTALSPTPTIALNSTSDTVTSPKGTPTDPPEDSVLAVDFTVVDIDENEVKLSDFYGKPIVINFWASWCPPCKAELPDFDLVYGELAGDVVFMMVDLTDGVRETVDIAAEYIEDNAYSFPVYFDTTGEAAQTYGISAIPSTIFIDADTNIIAWYEGQMSESMLRQGISLILHSDAKSLP